MGGTDYTGGGCDAILQTDRIKHSKPIACFFNRSLIPASVKFPAASNLSFTCGMNTRSGYECALRYPNIICNCSTARSPPHTPDASPTNATGLRSKLSGNFSMSTKYFSTPGNDPLYSGVITCNPGAA